MLRDASEVISNWWFVAIAIPVASVILSVLVGVVFKEKASGNEPQKGLQLDRRDVEQAAVALWVSSLGVIVSNTVGFINNNATVDILAEVLFRFGSGLAIVLVSLLGVIGVRKVWSWNPPAPTIIMVAGAAMCATGVAATWINVRG